MFELRHGRLHYLKCNNSLPVLLSHISSGGALAVLAIAGHSAIPAGDDRATYRMASGLSADITPYARRGNRPAQVEDDFIHDRRWRVHPR